MPKRAKPRPPFVDIPGERWRPFRDYVGYEISDWGRVRSFWGGAGQKGQGQRGLMATPKLIGGHVATSGHLGVALYHPGSRKADRFKVHTLVLEAFTGPCPPGLECCHGDGNPANNRLGNLRWDTPSENQRDTLRHGRHKNAKLTEADIPAIWTRLVAGETNVAIAKDYEVSGTAIAQIRSGKCWSHITCYLPGWPLVPPDRNDRQPTYIPDEFAKSEVEIWRPLPDWDAYRVSTWGRIMGCWEHKFGGWRGEMMRGEWRLRNLNSDKDGYQVFGVSAGDGSPRRTLKVHNAVLAAFAGPRPPRMVGCHNDGNPANNHAGNLRWDTQRANRLDQRRHAAAMAAI
jgi:hypothetical protein